MTRRRTPKMTIRFFFFGAGEIGEEDSGCTGDEADCNGADCVLTGMYSV